MGQDDFIIGLREIWGEANPFGISRDDFTRHVFVIGQTGVGKSSLLTSLFLQMAERGEGVAILDPHGDLASDLLSQLPRKRREDVVYFCPGDPEFVPAFNPIANSTPRNRHLLCSGLVAAMRSLFADSWGPRTQFLLTNCLMALMETPDATLLALPRLLVDARFRAWVLKFVKDPVVKSFWNNEFTRMDPRFRQEVIAPLQNKIGALLVNPCIRRMFGVVRNRIDLRYLIDHHKIFIADLSKGQLGEEGSSLVGSLLLALFHHAAMSRSDQPQEDRQFFQIFVDEYPSFGGTEIIASSLAEIRKNKVGLGLFAQHTAQLQEKVKAAIFGNVGSMLSFRVSESDADLLARQYGKHYVPEHFTGLDNYEIVVRLSHHGKQLQPFTGRTVPVPVPTRAVGSIQKSLCRSRERYCMNAQEIDKKAGRWMERRNWG